MISYTFYNTNVNTFYNNRQDEMLYISQTLTYVYTYIVLTYEIRNIFKHERRSILTSQISHNETTPETIQVITVKV